MGLKRYHRKTESRLAQTRGLLRRYGLRARKGLGQHFLVDEEVLALIIDTAQLKTDDVVVEIGPGLGILTRELARHAGQVVAVELDNRLATILRETLASRDNVTIVNEDVLRIEPAALLEKSAAIVPTTGYQVVANLPYYITSPVLRHFLEASVKPRSLIVMVQKEVAEEITARPGRMSLLGVSVQLYGQPTIISRVPAACFYPVPEVDSAILKVAVYPSPAVDIADQESFFTLVRAGFSAARKQLANSLTQSLGISKNEIVSLLEGADIAPQRRAETLSLAEWASLWRVFSGQGEPC